MIAPQVDINENDILQTSPELLNTLLKDHTLSTPEKQVNIFWATDNYAHRGKGYQYNDQITIEAITGENGNVIVPRALKSRATQQKRSREMAEVFTPSWICNSMNNLIDDAWFGRKGIFNTEVNNPDGTNTWIVNPEPITFPEGKTWHDYVKDTRLEITCGEAPFLVSRYDTVTGQPIPIDSRIGLLDRKLRIVSENTTTTSEWLTAAQAAFQSVYGYEWQGDNLLLAREALLFTFIDYFHAKFGKEPQLKSLLYIAYIISWNIWQMDGLKGVIPGSCMEHQAVQNTLFDPTDTITYCSQCEGCKSGDIRKHNGRYALIKDWGASKAKQKIRFIDLIK